MGTELRWQTLEANFVADANSAATWTNNTNENIYPRIVEFDGFVNEDTTDVWCDMRAQLAKDDTFQDGNSRTGWSPTAYGVGNGGGTGATFKQPGIVRKTCLYYRGAVVLRPNESINLHTLLGSGSPDAGGITVDIGYEFA